MGMNSEEDEFRRIEAEALRLWAAQTDDDDTQVYAKPWVGLTIEEIGDIFNNTPNPTEKVGPFVIRFSRAIETKLKEKNT
jgi:hypothetical protein